MKRPDKAGHWGTEVAVTRREQVQIGINVVLVVLSPVVIRFENQLTGRFKNNNLNADVDKNK